MPRSQPIQCAAQLLRSIVPVRRHASTLTPAANVLPDKLTTRRKTFADMPAARRLPLVGTKLDFLLAGAGKK